MRNHEAAGFLKRIKNKAKMEPIFSESSLKELGFHVEKNIAGTEFVYKIEGTKTKLVLSRMPFNDWCLFIRTPDESSIQLNPSSLDDVKVIQRVLAFGYYENCAEAWHSTSSDEN